ncbi:hypothetical protein [Demequina activiva]|uniref:Uncharacterized protein n=1 Tax=Demequina activiva TaxID=1582364 RepID=A0A919PZI0_9MICO|nr:hypothetical protein [Demequina activiva]GIG53287.1 hypothetical protein Dac01nite_00390 [Demequina activiva]
MINADAARPVRTRRALVAAALAIASAALLAVPAAAGTAATAVDTGVDSAVSTGATTARAQAATTMRDLSGGVLRVSGDTKVVGDGTRASCTAATLAYAMRSGGSISFDCGSTPMTIALDRTLFTCNTHNCKHAWQGGIPVEEMTLDGGGLITLSGGGERGIYYANSCEPSFGWLSSSCQNDHTLEVTFRSIGFTRGNATKGMPGKASVGGGGGGGAIAMRGNELTIENSWFYNNKCMTYHSDAGGGAVRVTGMEVPVTITGSTFKKNWCANGGAISSLHASLDITDSKIYHNTATGRGASSGRGGNGGGVYFDGTSDNVAITRTSVWDNKAFEGGSGIFYVSNNRTGSLTITDSKVFANTRETFWTNPYRDIFFKGRSLNVSGGIVR